MTGLMFAAIAFAGTHLVLATNPIRPMLLQQLGAGPYRGVYSLVAFGTLGWLIWAYTDVHHADFLWLPNTVTGSIARGVMLIAFVLLVAGALARNPTSMISENAVAEPVPGIVKITRHPVQWAILLWASSHMLANGDVASLLFFGSFAVTSGLGTVSMDARYRARGEPAWDAFYAETGNVPFAAIVSGRARLAASELNWVTIGAGAVVYVGIYVAHPWVAGVALF